MTAEALIGVGGALLGLAGALIKLAVDVRQARRQRQPPVLPATPGPGPIEEAEPLAPPPEDPLLPGRPRFVNRKKEMGDLIARVQSGHDNLLTIEGERWIGKSATATELMHHLRSCPPEGAFDPSARRFVWFDAHDGCPSLAEICGRLSLATGEQSLSTAAAADKREELRTHLGGGRTVLVLDNLSLDEDDRSRALIDVLEDLPNGSLVIASVNRPGELVAPRVPLGDLDTDDVEKLIDDRAQQLNLDGIELFDKEFAERLHELIGGNPGVIEWFLRSYHHTSEPLEERVAALEKGDELSELFEPAWRSLDAGCKGVLEANSFLGGEATAGQIAVACGRPEGEIRSAADELRREKLLTPVRGQGPTVFTCARAFQLFVSSKTAEETCARFRERLADHYIDHFTASPEDAEYGVSEVAAWRLLRKELYDAEDDNRMQALFRAVLDILFTLGQYDELIDAAFWAFESANRAGNLPAAALAGAMKAGTHAIRGEVQLAEDALAQGAVAAETAALPGPISRIRRCQGFVRYRKREARQALAAIEGTEQLSREGDEPINLVDTLDLRTAANWYLRRFDACEAAALASLEASAEMSWERARAYPLRYLAELAIQRRRPDDAERLLDEAYEIATRLADRRQRARVDITRARMCLLEGRLAVGGAAASRAVSEATRLGLPPEREEAAAVARALGRAQRSSLWRRYYAVRRPTRLSKAPVGGD